MGWNMRARAAPRGAAPLRPMTTEFFRCNFPQAPELHRVRAVDEIVGVTS